MATVGIVGGVGPESTIDYDRRILEAWGRDDPAIVSPRDRLLVRGLSWEAV